VSAAVLQRASLLTVQVWDATVASVAASSALDLLVVGPRLLATAQAGLLPYVQTLGEQVSELEHGPLSMRLVPI